MTEEEERIMERIYIGGLQPPHLTVDNLLERLEQSLGSVVELVVVGDDDDDKNKDDKNKGPTILRSTACYVHLQARVRKSPQQQEEEEEERAQQGNNNNNKSALEHIARMYHNVTWKGCKLKVEAAKPHFLQRLQQERQERSAITEQTNQLPLPVQPHSTATSNNNRRHLKIRQRYGEQVYTVDTKPYAVDSWNGMLNLKRKIERRRNHYQQERLQARHNNTTKTAVGQQQTTTQAAAADIRTQSKLNRAMHLRFSSPAAADDENNHIHENENYDKSSATITTRSDSSTDSSQGTTSSEDHHDVTTTTTPKPPRYVWSSSSSSSSSSSEDDDSNSTSSNITERHNVRKESPVIENKDKIPSSRGTCSSSSSSTSEDDNSSELAGGTNKDGIEQVITNPMNGKGASSSDDSEDSDADADLVAAGSNRGRKDMSKVPSEMEEMPIETVGDYNGEDDDNDDNDAQATANVTDGDSGNLLKDVEANLSILASLFPDMKTVQPRKVAGDDGGAATTENANNHKASQSGWSASGIMLRYDPRLDVPAESPEPTAAVEKDESVGETSSEGDDDNNNEHLLKSTKEFTKRGDDDSSDDSSEGSTSKSGSVSNTRVVENGGIHDEDEAADKTHESMNRQASEGNIYRQQKLEDLFREAREGAVTVLPEGMSSGISEAFSFGFDVGPEPTKAAGSFAFSFFPSAGDQDKEDNVAKHDNRNDAEGVKSAPPTEPATTTPAQIEEPQPQMSSFRRRGMFFPKDVLDRYQEDFYLMNDGLKILQDLERYHKDKDVQAHWKAERQSLTLDWKRKRKYAQQARTKNQKPYKQQRN
jgi:hypothetical protein